ncbi:hypothetical protein DEMA109039_04395 [Deinococcus marmoris]
MGMNLGEWIALVFALLVAGGSVYGLAMFVRWFQRVSKLPLGIRPPHHTAPTPPRPVDDLDREVFARVRAQQASSPRPTPAAVRQADTQGRGVSTWAKAQKQTATTRLHQPTPPVRSEIPDHLPIKVKGYFFSRSEQAFFRVLEEALPPGYRVFPNVRLNDLFLITAAPH